MTGYALLNYHVMAIVLKTDLILVNVRNALHTTYVLFE